MSKPTLLDMTQEILSAMSSDEVNSISDSAEAMQVATILKRKFFDICTRSGIVEYDDLFKLEPSLDIAKPVLMSIPEEITKMEWLKYFNTNDNGTGIDPGYEYVTIMPVTQFIDTVTSFNPSESNVDSFSFTVEINGVTTDYTFYYKNDLTPSICTVISNKWVVFDSYDNTQDSTLQESKTMAYGRYAPYWLMQDSFIPELDIEQFPLLIAEAKALAFYELKQQIHPLADREIKRQWSSVSKNKAVSASPTAFEQLPDFGRRGALNSNYWPFK